MSAPTRTDLPPGPPERAPAGAPATGELLGAWYREMARIRRFEETLLDLFGRGEIAGTTHTCIGQEANAVGVIAQLDRERDVVLGGHRCHGLYLALTGDVYGLLCEVMGRADGVCGGLGGSQHLCSGNFLANGVQGSIAPVAAGMALAERERGAGTIAVAFLGDGTMGQGVVYETLNIASLWSLPLLVVVEDNGYAQSTPKQLAVSGSIPARAAAFDIATAELDSTDVAEIHAVAGPLVASVRESGKPAFLVIRTYRLVPHSKGDEIRDPAEIEARRALDPLAVAGTRLDPALRARLDEEAAHEIADALAAARVAPIASPAEAG